MKICIIGTGISGLVAAHKLQAEHELTVYEADERIGGHTHTVQVDRSAGSVPVDTGFIVFNQATYPGFCALLRELDVDWQPSDMSFSVSCPSSGLEYNGTSLNGLFAQRSNLLRPSFWRMIGDIKRFYREAPRVLESKSDTQTLGEFLLRGNYSRLFIEKHLIPMGAAIWSATPDTMRNFPLRFLVQFFHNHGFMQWSDRPQWLVVKGGSRTYVERLIEPLRGRIHTGHAVRSVESTPKGVRVQTEHGHDELFERVILATHADTALSLLRNPSGLQRAILGAFRFQRNEAVLHTDKRLMPKRRRAWASWNYHARESNLGLPAVTYWMNNLQGLQTPEQYLVSLNRSEDILEHKVLGRYVYQHPIFTRATASAQERHGEIDGHGGLHYCGAYWRYGFHEDGVQSALRVVQRLKRGELVR